MTVCWRCQRPGADVRNRRGEPVHRDCLPASLEQPADQDHTALEVAYVEDGR